MQMRQHQVLFRMSEEEFSTLRNYAEKCGMKREEYIRRVLLGATPREAPPADYYTLITELRRIGLNINQVLKVAYTKDIIDVPLLRKTLDDYRKTEQMLWRSFSPEST